MELLAQATDAAKELAPYATLTLPALAWWTLQKLFSIERRMSSLEMVLKTRPCMVNKKGTCEETAVD